jgi:hypothetical protein
MGKRVRATAPVAFIAWRLGFQGRAVNFGVRVGFGTRDIYPTVPGTDVEAGDGTGRGGGGCQCGALAFLGFRV